MQGATINAAEPQARIQRKAVRGRPGVDTGARLTAADAALEGVEHQRLTVTLDRTADGAQLGAARNEAAQRLKRDMAAPTLHEP